MMAMKGFLVIFSMKKVVFAKLGRFERLSTIGGWPCFVYSTQPKISNCTLSLFDIMSFYHML